MSDYLWDKTGEADAEVARLEELLGELRHRPRALELPTEVEAHAATAQRRFRTAWLAVAAALLLAFMAVAFVALRPGEKGDNRQAASQAAPPPPRKSAPPQSAAPEVAASPFVKTAPQPEIRYVNVPNQNSPQKQEPRRVGERALNVRPERELTTTSINSRTEPERVAVQTPLRGGAGIFVDPFSRAEIAAQQQAKEQLVYALRLTSSKLKQVREKTRGIVEPKPAFDERNRIR